MATFLPVLCKSLAGSIVLSGGPGVQIGGSSTDYVTRSSSATQPLSASLLHEHTLSRQGCDLGVGETTGVQHRLAMLVEARRCTSGSARRPRKLDRGTEAAIGAEFRDHLAVRGMVGGHRLIDIEH